MKLRARMIPRVEMMETRALLSGGIVTPGAPALHVSVIKAEGGNQVDFSGTFNDNLYAQRTRRKVMFSGSKNFLDRLTSMFSLEYSENGFMSMMFVDTSGFTPARYNFTFVRKEFLGEIKTSVFDVQPRPEMGSGLFIGRVWIDDEAGNIVRFTGTFTTENHFFGKPVEMDYVITLHF